MEERKLIHKGMFFFALSFATTLGWTQTMDVAATVNGVEITRTKLDKQLAILVPQGPKTDAESFAQVRQEVLASLA